MLDNFLLFSSLSVKFIPYKEFKSIKNKQNNKNIKKTLFSLFLKDYTDDNVLVILVGNKLDKQDQRVINSTVAETFAKV